MTIVLTLVLLSLGIGFIVLVHICVVGRAIRREMAENTAVVVANAAGSTSMSRDDIEKLPCFNFVEKEIKGSDSPCPNCAVCLENYTVGEKCRLLPLCSHRFHAACVDLWLLRASICPICRANADVAASDGNRSHVGENRVESRDGDSTGEARVVGNEENANLNGSNEDIGGSLNLSMVVIEVRDGQDSPTTDLGDGKDVNGPSCSTQVVEKVQISDKDVNRSDSSTQFVE